MEHNVIQYVSEKIWTHNSKKNETLHLNPIFSSNSQIYYLIKLKDQKAAPIECQEELDVDVELLNWEDCAQNLVSGVSCWHEYNNL